MSEQKLDALAQLLEQAGEDPVRLDIVRRAQNFKRSWLELAQGLNELARSRAYEGWGYADLHEYCNKELQIRPATVDKLTLSYSAVQKHAPQVLDRDGVASALPSRDAVHYFARAVEEPAPEQPGAVRLDVPEDVVDQLRSAVFDEGHTVPELRRRFDPIIRPKPVETQQREAIRKVRTAAKRLIEAMPEVEGLAEKRVARVQAAVDALVRDLDTMNADETKAAEPVA